MTAARILLLCGLAAVGAEASVSLETTYAKDTTRLAARMTELEHQHKHRMKKIMNGMTTTKALSMLHKHTNQSVLALVESALSDAHRVKNKHHAKKNAGHLRRQPGYSGVDKAKALLNEMIQETQAKYDLEIQTCCDYDKSQSSLIEQARQDISNFNAEAAEARKEVLDAQDHIEICEKKLPELKDSLTLHNRQCVEDIKELKRQLQIIGEDLNVMSAILDMINCDKKAASASLLTFSGCVDGCGESFVSFKHADMMQKIQGLQHETTRQLLNDNLLHESEDEGEDQSQDQSEDESDDDQPALGSGTLPDRVPLRSGPCKTPVPEDKRTGKCSIDSNPNCEPMQEKFLVIQSGIEDKRDEIQLQLTQLTDSCKLTRTNLEAQISDFETQLQDQLTALAAATKKQNTAEEQSRLKSVELTALLTDYDQMTARCHKNYESLEGDECGLKKIRGEIYKMKGQDEPAFFQDCVVSDWISSDCSKTCGGGELKMSRTILTNPVGGASCPVMEEVKSCNEAACPIDCKVGDWGGWSSCTAKCGGGLMERARDTLQEPAHGGVPCDAVHEAKSCNLQSCDQDCQLSDWTAWGACSKSCKKGESNRVKNIIVAQIGGGTCADSRDVTRFEAENCNDFQCKGAFQKFKYFKFTPDSLRNSRRANSVQVAEMKFKDGVGQVIQKKSAGWKAENPGGKSPGGESPSKAVDDISYSKWLDFNKKSLIMTAPDETEVSEFAFSTANDASERDPVKWTLYGSKDKRSWSLLYKQADSGQTPSSRHADTAWYPVATEPLKCASSVDVVLVLDGSGSLRQAGWDATVKAAEMMVNSFMDSGKVQMAVLLFSRKSTWVQHFSGDKSKTLSNIKALKWPKGGTKTSMALDTAAAELSLGRADAQSVVIVVTDGKPQSPRKTGLAAERLRKQARLMWVPVTKYAPLAQIKEMASYPKADNILVVHDFGALEDPRTIDDMITNVCPSMY